MRKLKLDESSIPYLPSLHDSMTRVSSMQELQTTLGRRRYSTSSIMDILEKTKVESTNQKILPTIDLSKISEFNPTISLQNSIRKYPIKNPKLYINRDQTIKFCPYNHRFEQYHAAQKCKPKVTKDFFDQQVKQSSNLILKSVQQDYEALLHAFEEVETQKERQLKFILIDDEIKQELENVSFIEAISGLSFKEIRKRPIKEQIDLIVDLLENRVDYVQDALFDLVKEIIVFVIQKIKQNRSIKQYFYMCFIYSVILEAFGKLQMAIQQLQHLLYLSNIYQIYQIKLVLYYRVGCCLIRNQQYDKALIIGKKLLKLSWLLDSSEYEIKNYFVISKAHYGLGKIKQAQIFYNRYLDCAIEKNQHHRDIGKKYMRAYMTENQLSQHKHSHSFDDYDLDLLINREKDKASVSQKCLKERQLEKEHLIGDKVYFSNKPLQKMQSQPSQFNKNYIHINDKSQNRNLALYFSEVSTYTHKNNQIQQIYRPKHSVPILVKLLHSFQSQL